LWTILSGEGGIIDDATNPATLFTGETGITYILKWQITTECATSQDETTVIFANIQLGEPYQGGIVAYILQPGDPGYDANVKHGIIAAASDQSTGIQWYNGTHITTGATDTDLGTGSANTTLIIDIQGATATDYAAGLARAYTGGGYSDWYFPSKDELNKLYLSKNLIGGFASAYYWSSSEDASNLAWVQHFSNGYQGYDNKIYTNRVRAVRAF